MDDEVKTLYCMEMGYRSVAKVYKHKMHNIYSSCGDEIKDKDLSGSSYFGQLTIHRAECTRANLLTATTPIIYLCSKIDCK